MELEEDVYRAKLPEPIASLVEFYLPTLSKFAGGRTRTVLEKMCAVELPESADDRLPSIISSYRDAIDRAGKLDKEIEKTDCVIDQIVYVLYGLTDEEIKTVEEEVS